MKRLAVLIFILLVSSGWTAEKRFIVELSEPPVAKVMAKNLKTKMADAHRQRVMSQQEEVLERIQSKVDVTVTRRLNTIMNALILDMDESSVDKLKEIDGVQAVFEDRIYHMTLDEADRNSRIHVLRHRLGMDAEQMGAGMKIAILDMGIDIGNPMFDDTGYSLPDGFDPGPDNEAGFTNNKVIVAKNYGNDNSADDEYGHGTASASCAAGRQVLAEWGDYSFVIKGSAPGAWLGNYKVFNRVDPTNGDTGAPSTAIITAMDDAVNDGMDVINLSLGGDAGGFDPYATAVENATAAGVIVCISAGNEGYDMTGSNLSTFDLAEESISSPGNRPEAITVGASENGRTIPGAGIIEAYGADVPGSLRGFDYGVDTAVSIGLDSFGPFEVVDITDLGVNEEGCDAYPGGVDLTGKIALIKRGTCSFCTKIFHAENAGAVGAIIYNHTPDGLENGGILNMDVTGEGCETYPINIPGYFIRLEEGQDLKQLLDDGFVVFASFSRYPANSSGYKATFSSFGPAKPDLLLKPDLVAVGQQLTLATQDQYSLIHPTDGYEMTMYDETGFTVLASGTSFSSPLVAGYAAVLKQVYPEFTPAQIKGILSNTGDFTQNYHQVVKGMDGLRYHAGYASPVFQGGGRVNMVRAGEARITFPSNNHSFGDVDLATKSGSVSFEIPIENITDQPVSLKPTLMPILDNELVSASLGSTGIIEIPAGGQGTVELILDYESEVASDAQGYVLFYDNYGNEYQFPYFGRFQSDTSSYAAGSDTDGDGLTKSEEQFMGTDIFTDDSDGDGFTDGEEVDSYSTDPTNQTSNPDMPSYGVKRYIPYTSTEYDRQGEVDTDIYVVNVSYSPANVAVYFFNRNGSIVQTPRVYQVEGRGWIRVRANTNLDPDNYGWAMVTANRTVEAFGEYRTLSMDGEVLYADAVPGTESLSSSLYVPHVAEQTWQWNTYVGLANPGSEDLDVTFTPQGGDPVSVPSFGIVGTSTFSEVVNQIYGGDYPFDTADSDHWWGKIAVSSAAKAPGLVGMESFTQVREDRNMYQSAGLLLNGDAATEFIISHVETSWLWWTGIALNNPSSTDATVTFTPYDNSGTALTETTFTLEAGAKLARLVDWFWTNEALAYPETTSWIRVTSDQPITGYELFGIDSSGDAGDDRDALAGVEALTNPSDTLVYPYTPKATDREWSGIVLLNASESAVNITMRGYNALGDQVASKTQTLVSGQRIVSVVNEGLFGSVSDDIRWVEVSASAPIYGFELFGGQNFLYLSGIPAL